MDPLTVLPILTASLVIVLVVIKLYQLLRIKLPKRVNCWFCNKNTSVPCKYKDSWKCPNCEQYNGFTPDGGYNRVLHSQYNVSLNKTAYLNPSRKPWSGVNGLCQFCNINQELKVAQLAAFVPINASNFDEEVDVYRMELDKAYRLCNKCEIVLSEKLLKQSSWLKNVYQNLDSFLNKKTETFNQIKSRRFYYAYITAIISAGLFLCAASHFQLGKEISDYIVSQVQLLTNLYPLPESLLLPDISHKLNILYSWISLHDIPLLLTGFGTVLQLLEAFEQQNMSAALGVVTWLILTFLSTRNFGLVPVVEMLAGGVTFVVSIMHIKDLKFLRLHAAESVFNKLSMASTDTPHHRVQPVSNKKQNRLKSPSKPIPKISRPLTPSFDFSPTPSLINSNMKFSPSFTNLNPKVSQSFTNYNFGHNPSLKSPFPEDLGLSKLNLGTMKSQNKQHSPFETRSYGNKISNNLFRPVLTPPKLSVESLYSDIQTRSSSQSSGFGSSASQHCGTGPPSVVGDFDTASNVGCSVSPYSPSMYNSLYQYPVDSVYPVSPYFHFSQHRMYQTFPTPALHDMSYNSSKSDSTLGSIKNAIVALSMPLLILSNLALVWIVVCKEALVR